MPSWEKAWKNGELNEVQSAFWKPKPPEELYDVDADPYNIHNLAGEASYKKVLLRMREANRKWIMEVKDAGFVPEPMMVEIAKDRSLYDYARSGDYPLQKIMETAELASSKDPAALPRLKKALSDKNPVVRYWAVTGCTILSSAAAPATDQLSKLLLDPEISVRIAAAEALYQLSEKEKAIAVLEQALGSDNLMARLQALNVLENIGDGARPALDNIARLLKDDVKDGDYDVRAAKHIIAKLGR